MRILSDCLAGATETVHFIDPSELLRPEVEFAAKPIEAFRDYSLDDSDPLLKRVKDTYYNMHTNQTVDFVRDKTDSWCKFNHVRATIMEALDLLNNLIDESDPDVNIPNIVHAFQTAERIRQDFPDLDWFHLTGLIHDLGKILALHGEPQWAVVGDTFPVGCAYSDNIVYGIRSFEDNPDLKSELYSSRLGIYEENCGLSNVTMSWGHDEYLYRVLKHNKTTLPEESLYMIRFHSFYPWHTGGDYSYLCEKKDEDMMKWVRLFNKYDLYTKSTTIPDIEAIRPYYQSLIDKYLPEELEW